MVENIHLISSNRYPCMSVCMYTVCVCFARVECIIILININVQARWRYFSRILILALSDARLSPETLFPYVSY